MKIVSVMFPLAVFYMQSLMVLLLELFTCSLSMVLLMPLRVDVYCKIISAIAIVSWTKGELVSC